MQNGRGDFEIRLRSLLIAQHSVCDQGQIDLAQALRCGRQHFLVGPGVIQIRGPGIYAGGAPGEQVLGYRCQPVAVPGHQHETSIPGREPAHGRDGNAGGRA